MSYTPKFIAIAEYMSADNLRFYARPGWEPDVLHPLYDYASADRIAVSPDGQRIAIYRVYPRALVVCDIESGEVVWETSTVASTVTGIAWTPDGSALFVSSEGSPYLRRYSGAIGAVVATATVVQGCYGVTISRNGDFLAVGHASAPHVSVLNVQSNTWIAGVSDTSAMYTLRFVGGDQYVAGFGSSGLRVYKLDGWVKASTGIFSGGTNPFVYGIADTADGARMLHSTGAGLQHVDTETWSVVHTTPTGGALLGLRPSPDYSMYLCPKGTSGVDILHAVDWSVQVDAVQPRAEGISSATMDVAFGGVYTPPAPTFWTRFARTAEEL